MKKIFFLFAILISLHTHATSLPRELIPILSQQQILHGNEFAREALLLDVAVVVKQKGYTAKSTYLFWGDDQVKRVGLKSFLENLKKDMEALGVSIFDRAENPEKNTSSTRLHVKLKAVEKVLLVMTFEMDLRYRSNSHPHFASDWSYLKERMFTGGDGVLEKDKCLHQGAVLPLLLEKQNLSLHEIVEEGKGVVLNALILENSTYIHLLIRLIRFCYDIPEDVNFADDSLNQVWQCFPELKKNLGW